MGDRSFIVAAVSSALLFPQTPTPLLGGKPCILGEGGPMARRPRVLGWAVLRAILRSHRFHRMSNIGIYHMGVVRNIVVMPARVLHYCGGQLEYAGCQADLSPADHGRPVSSPARARGSSGSPGPHDGASKRARGFPPAPPNPSKRARAHLLCVCVCCLCLICACVVCVGCCLRSGLGSRRRGFQRARKGRWQQKSAGICRGVRLACVPGKARGFGPSRPPRKG